MKRELFVCTRQRPRRGQALPTQLTMTSMQLNARLLIKKLKITALQNSFKHRVNSWSLSYLHPLSLPVIVRGHSHHLSFSCDYSFFLLVPLFQLAHNCLSRQEFLLQYPFPALRAQGRNQSGKRNLTVMYSMYLIQLLEIESAEQEEGVDGSEVRA